MKKRCTTELLIKYLYHETTTAETLHVEEVMANNWDIQEELDDLERSYRALPKVSFSPKTSTIQSILGYSSEKPAIEPYV